MSTQSVVIGITAKSTGVDEELKKTKGKFDKLNESLMSDKAQGAVQGMTKSLKGLSGMGDSLGGVFKNIIGGFSSMLSPIGLATAAIAGLITLGVNLYKKLTLSHEEYIDYLNHSREQSQKRLDNVNKQENEDRGYFERLKQLNQTEQISNAIKTQTIMLIQILTKRYGDLGLSIDETTGKIIGLDNALNVFESRIAKMKLKEMKNIVDNAQMVAGANLENIAKGWVGSIMPNNIFNRVKSNNPFISEQQKSKYSWGNEQQQQEVLNTAKRRRLEWNIDIPIKFDSKEYQEVLKKFQMLSMKQKSQGLSASEKEELNFYQMKIKNLMQIEILQRKLKVAEQMVDATKADSETNKKWRALALSIQDLINKTEHYNIEAEKSDVGQIGRMNRLKALSNQLMQSRLKGAQAERQTLALLKEQKNMQQQYDFSRKDKADKMAFYDAKINVQGKRAQDAGLVTKLSSQGSDFLEKAYPEYDELLEKEKDQTITDDERQTLDMYKKVFGKRLQIYRDAKRQYEELLKKENRTSAEQKTLEQSKLTMDVGSMNYYKLKKQQARLQDKAKSGDILADDFNKLLEINKQIALIEEGMKNGKKEQAQAEKELLALTLKRKQIEDELKDTFKDGQSALDAELALQQAIAEGDIKAIERQKIINGLKAKGYDIDKMKKQGINVDEDIDALAQKNMQVNAVKYMNGQTKNLDRQIQLMQLKLQGKMDQIEMQRLLNELQDKGIKLSQKQIDKIIQKRKELKQLEFASSYQDQARGLIAQARSISLPRKQAMYENKKAEYEAKYGELTEKQLDRIKRLVDAQAMIQDFQAMAKPDFGKYEVKTNELTARGGFQTGATIYADKDNVNKQIKNYAQKQTTLLSAIKAILEDGGTY